MQKRRCEGGRDEEDRGGGEVREDNERKKREEIEK